MENYKTIGKCIFLQARNPFLSICVLILSGQLTLGWFFLFSFSNWIFFLPPWRPTGRARFIIHKFLCKGKETMKTWTKTFLQISFLLLDSGFLFCYLWTTKVFLKTTKYITYWVHKVHTVCVYHGYNSMFETAGWIHVLKRPLQSSIIGFGACKGFTEYLWNREESNIQAEG